MNMRRLFPVLTLAVLVGTCQAAEKHIDVLDYFLPGTNVTSHYTIGGFNVHTCPDPDNAGMKSLILHKGSSVSNYEVYQITPTQLLLRYEVVRPKRKGSRENWIRRYHELGDGFARTAGLLWMPRDITPGKTNFTSRAAVDRYAFNPNIRAYTIRPSESSQEAISFNSIVWSSDPWHSNNRTGLPIDSVIRLISQWQHDGQIYETYDYAKGLGLINWQWMERISTLTRLSGDKTGKLFNCENGAVYLQSAGDKTHPPSIFQYDVKKRLIGSALPVIPFTSHWKPNLGPQWYVIYRDLSREGLLEKKSEVLSDSFKLPEWYTRPNATIAHLPPLYTKP
jgi:hypothetical protein